MAELAFSLSGATRRRSPSGPRGRYTFRPNRVIPAPLPSAHFSLILLSVAVDIQISVSLVVWLGILESLTNLLNIAFVLLSLDR